MTPKEQAQAPVAGMTIEYSYRGQRDFLYVTRIEETANGTVLVYYKDTEGSNPDEETYLVLDSGWQILIRQVINVRSVSLESTWEV